MICTAIKPQKTHESFKETSPTNMKLITSVLTVLVFVNAVYSAAMREGGEDLLRFLNDAFKMNLPPGDLEPTKFTETVLVTEKTPHPTDPTAECKAPEIVNVAEFSATTPKPNTAKITGIAEDGSNESSNTDSGLTERTSAEDSRDYESYKKSQLRSKLIDIQKMLQEHYNSAESLSIDRTDLDTEMMHGTNKHPIKATVMKDISSEEMVKPEENVRYRSIRMIENYQSDQRHESDKPQQRTSKRAVDLNSPEIVVTPDSQIPDTDSEELTTGRAARQTVRLVSHQSTVKSALLKNDQTNITVDKEEYNSSNSVQGTADNSTEMTGQNPACAETSAEHPRGENNSKVDQKIQKDTMSYQNQLRKICPRKQVRTSKIPREQLDYDSPERVSRELLDNSSERLNEHVAVFL